MENNGPIKDDIEKASDGNLLATFGYDSNTALDNGGAVDQPLAGWNDGVAAGDSDDGGYYYSYTTSFGMPIADFEGNAFAALDFVRNNTGKFDGEGYENDPNEKEMDFLIPNLLTDMYLTSEFEAYPGWFSGDSPWIFVGNDPAWLQTTEPVGRLRDIRANCSDGPITISSATNLSITIENSPGGSFGVDADWWVLAKTSIAGWYSYDYPSDTWSPGINVTAQGPLGNLPCYEVLNFTGLLPGTYDFYFGVDTMMNGVIDLDELYYDDVRVEVLPAE